MKKLTTLSLFFILLLIQISSASFIKANGSQLKLNSDTIYLQGINFAYDRVASDNPNDEWQIADSSDWGTPVTNWFAKEHFKKISDIGFNSVRLNLSYRIFEDNANPGTYKNSGWELLDTIISWAKELNLYLIIDMHVAPGGAGIVSKMGAGWKTWDDITTQDRFVALWKEIATRYKDEPTIAAYDILNEPAPTKSSSQWKILSQELVDTIRTVDTNHLIIVELVNWIFDSLNNSPLSDYDTTLLKEFQTLINDDNIMYDYHYYLPTQYTLQDEVGNDGRGYPDSSIFHTTFSGTSMSRDSIYLAHEMDQVIKFWQASNVPINFGEWGTAGSAFKEDSTKGGIQYVQDMLSLMKERKINWQFYYIIYLYSSIWNDVTGMNDPVIENPNLITAFTNYFLDTATSIINNNFNNIKKSKFIRNDKSIAKIYTLKGQLIYRGTIKANTIKYFSQNHKGIFLISYENSNGISSKKKFISLK